jgi:hypothetical protein
MNTIIKVKEVDVFITLLMNYQLDYKKMRKVIQKLMKRTDLHISQGFLKFLLTVKNPHKYIDQALEESDLIPELIDSLTKENYFGMVRVGDDFYPVTLEFEEDSDYLWSQENEEVVGVACAHQTMNDLKKEHLKCTVFLFQGFGFTGRPMEFSIAKSLRNNPYKPGYKNTQYKVPIKK